MREIRGSGGKNTKEVVWMKTCKNCGAQLEDQAKFCRYCGEAADDTTAQFSTQNTGSMYGNQNTGNMFGNQQNTGNMYGNQQNTGNVYGGQQGGYQNYQNAGYGGYQQPAPVSKSSGAAIGALVLGLIGIITGFFGASFMVAGVIISSYNFVAFLLYLPSILGVILGIAGIAQSGKPGVGGRGLAIAGLVLGIIFLVIWLIVGMIAVSEVGAVGSYYSLW